MKLSVKYKLFLALLSAHCLVYLAMYSFGYYNFQRGFLEYVSRIEERQVPALAQGLADFYATYGSWSPLRSDYNKWSNLIRDSIESSSDLDLITTRSRIPSRPGPAPPFTPNDWYYTSEYSPARPYLHLLDAQENIMVGTPGVFQRELANLTPIVVNDETVGYLSVTSRQRLSEQADLLFAAQQQNEFFLLALGLSMISALIAFPASVWLTRPIREVVAGTRNLTSGAYNARIPVRSNDELGQLASDFNTLALTLEQNRSARQQWIADISHELRTPLAILQGELESMQDGIRPLDKDSLDSLHHEILHLSTLVKDLHELSLSDLGALVYAKGRVNLSEILEQAVDLQQQLAARHGIKVSLNIESPKADGTIEMLGDPNRLQQLFDNLLTNSFRYTDAGGELHITLRQEHDSVVIEWCDSTPGVSDADLGHLFERLYRVETSRNRAKGGSGLGLAICQNIVQGHEGSITASHSPLGGLKLTIVFPQRAQP
ncbi:MAG: HAMP domain-containing protein [Pseudomonadales bacterium]|jgi:two-component system sensor histidine kinase BaeS|nr:HAMP domain-containing protein [Pseudomonadales bacterium]